MDKYLKGVVASNGLSMGKAYLFKKTEVKVVKKHIENEDIASEIKKIDDAINKYYDELNKRKFSSGEEKAVIDAHKELITDPYLKDSVTGKIEQENVSSDYALEQTIKEMVAMMEALDDPYLQERATDYKDIGEQIMYKLKGVEAQNLSDLDDQYIIIADELTPTDTSTMDKENVLGFATNLGGKTSHASIIAQTLSIPAIVGMQDVTENVEHGEFIILDAEEGKLILDPSEEVIEEYKKKIEEAEERKARLEKMRFEDAITKDGRQVEVSCNIGNVEDLELGLEQGADGVGLFRTEFLYMESSGFPSEEVQYQAYAEAAKMLGDKPLIIRTLDIGGDKGLDYFKFPEEQNPFLGWRATRICFDLEGTFKNQIKAILRASAHGNVKFLLPMIISVEEIKRFNDLMKVCMKELDEAGKEYDPNTEVGIMVETPASVFVARELIEHCDFFSIGTNDLTQYILAVDRGNEKISDLYNYFHPAVLRAIKKVIDASHDAGKWTGMCGSMAADPKATYLLLGLGLDEFSAVGSQIAHIKDIVIRADYEEAKKYADEVLKLSSVTEVEEKLK